MNRLATLLFAAAAAPAFSAESAIEIVRRSLDHDNRNWERANDYTFERRSVQKQLDGDGKVRSTESETRDIIVLYGRPLSRLIEKNGKPVSGKDQAREEERFNKELDKRRRESQDVNGKERERYLKRREEQRQFAREIPEAFNFTLAGEEVVDGHAAYIISAEPKPGYEPRDPRARFLQKMRGKLWIDKQEYQWIKVEAETTDTISFGLFLARLGPGARLIFEQQRVNGELWLPAHAFIKLDARLALLKKLRGEVQIDYLNYRKFSTDSTITIIE
jgi:hypothetical protein